MPKLKRLSSKELVSIFRSYGFEISSKRGSHIKMVKLKPGVGKQTVLIPDHKQIDIGTLKEIYRQSARYFTETELREIFYTE